MNKNIVSFFSDKKLLLIIVLAFLLEMYNIIFMSSWLNILLTIPQVLVVLYYIVKNDIRSAFILHVFFYLTGCDATSASTEMQLLSYPEIKLVGPFTLSYIILGLLWLKSRKINVCKSSPLLLQFHQLLKIFMIVAVIIGLFGIVFLSYRISDFFLAFIYILVGYIFVDLLIKLYDDFFLQLCYNCGLALLVAAPFATFITFFVLNITAEYSVFDALIFNEEFMMAPILILFLFYQSNHKPIILISILAYVSCVAVAGRGGFFLNIFAAMVSLILLTYLSKGGLFLYRKILYYVIPILTFLGITYIGVVSIEGGVSLAGNKLKELISLLSVVGSLGSASFELTDISDSPYIRIAETFNIIDNGRYNIFYLILGHGYGGYYVDSTGMFQNVDVSIGGFPQEVVNSGRFGYAHSFLPCTLLWNGVWGLYLLVRLGISYLKQLKHSPFFFAAFLLFFYSFYFNTSMFIATAFALYIAELKLISKN